MLLKFILYGVEIVHIFISTDDILFWDVLALLWQFPKTPEREYSLEASFWGESHRSILVEWHGT